MVNKVIHSHAEGKCQNLMFFSIFTDHISELANISKNQRTDSKKMFLKDHDTDTISWHHYIITFAFTILC